MSFIYHFFAGDWDERHSVEDDLVEENLRLGQLWNACNYLPLQAKRRVHQGRFAEAAEILERIAKLEDLYAYDLAASNRLAVKMYLRLEQRRLPEALDAATKHYESFHEDLLNLLALGTRSRIELLLGQPQDAEESLIRAGAIVKRLPFLPPFHLSEYLLGQLGLTLDRLETAVARQEGQAASRLRRQARQHARKVLAKAPKVAWQLPETYRLLGRCAWLLQKERRALGSWKRSVEEAERLGMRPELGRTYLEIGRRLTEAGREGRFGEFDAGACLDRAEKIFRELDLEWDLAQVHRARDSVRSGSSA
jgi:tetratricopeptide (TPR) repeat protein